jgi:hypothetical protein
MFVLLDVQQGHARLFSGEPVCRLLGEQALGDRLQRPGLGHDVVDRDGSPWVTMAAAEASIKRDDREHTLGAVGRRVAHDVLPEGDGPVQKFILGQPHPAHPAASLERS